MLLSATKRLYVSLGRSVCPGCISLLFRAGMFFGVALFQSISPSGSLRLSLYSSITVHLFFASFSLFFFPSLLPLPPALIFPFLLPLAPHTSFPRFSPLGLGNHAGGSRRFPGVGRCVDRVGRGSRGAGVCLGGAQRHQDLSEVAAHRRREEDHRHRHQQIRL